MATQESSTPQKKSKEAEAAKAVKNAEDQIKRASIKDGINPKGGA